MKRKTKAFIIKVPKLLNIVDVLAEKSELYTYVADSKTGFPVMNIIMELENTINTEITGDFNRIAIMYYLIDFFKERDLILGELYTKGQWDRIININAEGIKETTRNRWLQQGLLKDILKEIC